MKHSSLRYVMVGLVAFGSDYLTLLTLLYVLKVPLQLATAIGFLVGFTISFTTNKNWVFGNNRQRKKLARQMVEYIILVLFNLIFTVWAVSLLNDYSIKPAIGKLLVMALIMSWNYAIFRWVIFAGELK